MRFSPNDMHNLELAVEKCFDKFSIDELAIISMGFFKSKVPVRNFNTISRIIDKILENPSAVHEVSLAALLKVIRLSRKIPIDDKIYDLLEKLQCEVSRLSIMCNVHIALLSCSTLTLHEGCLLKIAEVVLKNITNARIKDFERLVLTFGTFNLLPQTPDNFIEKVIDELRKPYREQEILTHGRSFACCIAHLGLSGYYPLDLIEKTLNKPFLEQTYGKYCLSYGREILSLNNFVKIFHKNANIDLSDKESLTLAKRYTDYLPDENYAKQYNVTEKLYMDIKRVIESDRGANYVVGHHIVTHHQRGDLIICDDVNNRPVAVQDVFSNIKFGTLCSAPNDNNIWIALIVVGRNGMLYKDNKPSGHFLSKIRELNALGFKAAPVCWTYYSECKTHEEKLKYINTVIKEAKSIR
ncbi:unnamed protein product [Leptosia nina]|uniref:RAP domain-containing protein n=1 Tax=Leptosia nina TaxID=320188 RepID=A0AAV1JUA1_9NEOP